MPRTALLAVTGLSLLLAAIGCSTAASSQAPTAQPQAVSAAAIRAVGKHKGDYLPAHNWKIEIDGVISGGFKEMSLEIDGKPATGFKEIVGLESEIEVVEFKDGDDPITHKRAGKAKYKNIVLKQGFFAAEGLQAWLDQGAKDPAKRKSGSIIYLDREGQEVLRYTFFEAWPSATRGGKIITDRDTGIAADLAIASELELVVTDFARDHFALGKARHDTAKNSVGNIR
jgi:phage tail-like protein